MPGTRVGPLAFTVFLYGLFVAGCGASPATSPDSVAGSSSTSSGGAAGAGSANARPFKGDCETTISAVNAPPLDSCPVFQAAPSAFIAIGGQCQLSHLGRSSLQATQQLLFQLDSAGHPVIVNGQPVVSALRNCSVLTAANGDELRHTTVGDVKPGAGPGTVSFAGTIMFTGGTGRFSAASGSATFDGSASLITNTGAFSMTGSVKY
jgi:hypothetical protein